MICEKSKYEYELKDGSITIKEKPKAGWYPFLKVKHHYSKHDWQHMR